MRPEWVKARAVQAEADELYAPVCGRCGTAPGYSPEAHRCGERWSYGLWCGRCDHHENEHRGRPRYDWQPAGCQHRDYTDDQTAPGWTLPVRCLCPKRVGARCLDCGEWTRGRLCGDCRGRRRVAAAEEANRVWRSSPEYQAEVERKEQRRWLREGQQTLVAIRRELRSRGASR